MHSICKVSWIESIFPVISHFRRVCSWLCMFSMTLLTIYIISCPVISNLSHMPAVLLTFLCDFIDLIHFIYMLEHGRRHMHHVPECFPKACWEIAWPRLNLISMIKYLIIMGNHSFLNIKYTNHNKMHIESHYYKKRW